MAEESARVAQRCEEAKSTSELLLCECGLRKFPDAVFFLMKGTELDKVDLSHNQLQKIPAKLGTKFASITSKQGRSQDFSRGGVQFAEILLTTPTFKKHAHLFVNRGTCSVQNLRVFFYYCSLQKSS